MARRYVKNTNTSCLALLHSYTCYFTPRALNDDSEVGTPAPAWIDSVGVTLFLPQATEITALVRTHRDLFEDCVVCSISLCRCTSSFPLGINRDEITETRPALTQASFQEFPTEKGRRRYVANVFGGLKYSQSRQTVVTYYAIDHVVIRLNFNLVILRD